MSSPTGLPEIESITVQAEFRGACPNCGDSLQTATGQMKDHSQDRRVSYAWCMDCLTVHAVAIESWAEDGNREFGKYSQIPVFRLVTQETECDED